MEAQGLRERKKQRTREQIAETARRLFGEHGFEAVTVAQIARQAEVSEQTVFNYFPTKEDLVFWRLEAFQDELLAAIRDRDAGDTALRAFTRFILSPRGLLDGRPIDPQMEGLIRTIATSPALLAREQQIFVRYTAALAAELAAETGASVEDVEPWIAANAFIGLHRTLVALTRAKLLAGVRNPRLAREVRAQARRAADLLEAGLGGYAAKPAEPPPG